MHNVGDLVTHRDKSSLCVIIFSGKANSEACNSSLNRSRLVSFMQDIYYVFDGMKVVGPLFSHEITRYDTMGQKGP